MEGTWKSNTKPICIWRCERPELERKTGIAALLAKLKPVLASAFDPKQTFKVARNASDAHRPIFFYVPGQLSAWNASMMAFLVTIWGTWKWLYKRPAIRASTAMAKLVIETASSSGRTS